MLWLSIALVIIATEAFYLANKYIDQKHALNTKSSKEELSAAVEELHKQFDERINKTWGTISSTKQELEALKLQIGLKGNR